MQLGQARTCSRPRTRRRKRFSEFGFRQRMLRLMKHSSTTFTSYSASRSVLDLAELGPLPLLTSTTSEQIFDMMSIMVMQRRFGRKGAKQVQPSHFTQAEEHQIRLNR